MLCETCVATGWHSPSTELVIEKYSIELLQAVVDLWINVRAHLFAKEWTAKFERKHKKGTRKELKSRED